jgi:NAD(P)-dependent dehydrogenase (short-subunit alcohol dehydrogenase family)
VSDEVVRHPFVLVTGASGSIGCATIRSLSARGCLVATLDKDPLPADEAALVAAHATLDLCDDAAVGEAALDLGDLGALTHVIAVAGGGDVEELAHGDPPTEPLAVFSRVVENNLHTAFVTIRQTVPLLRGATGDRSITLVGSINAFGGYAAPAYSAAKAGLIGLVNSLARPLGADGIRINCLALGTVDTENLRRLVAAPGVQFDLQAVAERTPLGHVLDPADVSAALLNVALDMTGLTGATVVLDSGQMRVR